MEAVCGSARAGNRIIDLHLHQPAAGGVIDAIRGDPGPSGPISIQIPIPIPIPILIRRDPRRCNYMAARRRERLLLISTAPDHHQGAGAQMVAGRRTQKGRVRRD